MSKSKTVSTFRKKWQDSKKELPPKLLKDLDLNKGLGPAMDVLEKALEDAFDPKCKDQEKAKQKVQKALNDVYKKITVYVAKIKSTNEAQPEHGVHLYAIQHVLSEFDRGLKKGDKEQLGLDVPAVTFTDKHKFDLTPPKLEQEDLPEKTTRKIGFDMSRNKVDLYDPKKERDPESIPVPGRDAMPEKGILKKEGAPKKNREDREIDSEKEDLEDKQQVYGRFLKALKQDGEEVFKVWEEKGVSWVKFLEDQSTQGKILDAIRALKNKYTEHVTTTRAMPYVSKDAEETKKKYETGINDFVNAVFPKEVAGMANEVAKLLRFAKVPTEKEVLERRQKVFAKFLEALGQNKQDPAKLFATWKDSAQGWLGAVEGVPYAIRVKSAATAANKQCVALSESLVAEGFNHEEATQKFQAYEEAVKKLVELIPKEMRELRTETTKMIERMQLKLAAAQLEARG